MIFECCVCKRWLNWSIWHPHLKVSILLVMVLSLKLLEMLLQIFIFQSFNICSANSVGGIGNTDSRSFNWTDNSGSGEDFLQRPGQFPDHFASTTEKRTRYLVIWTTIILDPHSLHLQIHRKSFHGVMFTFFSPQLDIPPIYYTIRRSAAQPGLPLH